jgi:glycosyltransferase involved in cell wall biosynthesis
MMPSVLMVTRELGNDRRYGLGRSLEPVVDGLRKQGWQVRYVTQEDMSPSDRTRRDRLNARIAGWWGLAGRPHRQHMLYAWSERLWMGWWAAALCRREGWRRVHLHDPWLALGFLLGAWRQGLRGVRWGLTEHGFGSYSVATHVDGLPQGAQAQRLFRRIENGVLQRADWVVTPTRLAAQQLARDLCLPDVPPHWQTIAHPRPSADALPHSREQARRQLGWPADALVVLGVGRLVPLKRFDLTLAAFIAVARHVPALCLCLLGEGDRSELMRVAHAAGLADRVWMTHTDHMAPYYRAADVYVSTSSTESFGMANLEALSHGLPCVVTAVGGVPEVVGAGALLVPCELQAVQDALLRVCTDPQERQAWARAAVDAAQHCPNRDTIVQAYAQLYS